MKINKLILTTCVLVTAISTQASQKAIPPSPPKPAHTDTHKHHGNHTTVNVKAPTAQRIKQNQKKDQLTESKESQKSAKNLGPQAALGQDVSSAQNAPGVCHVNAFATSNSTTLINEIKTQGPNCVNELFNAASNIQVTAYSSDNMNAVANHVKSLSSTYAGGGDVDIEALFLYLRAGYYVEFYNNGVSFISWVKPSVKGAIDAFVNNANFYQDNDAHGKTLSEVIITMDSSEQQDIYLPVVKGWLSRWNQSYAAKWNMRSAVNGIFTILFRGQYNANFKTMVTSDTTLISQLNSFTQQNWMINSESEYLISNAARELGRMKMYGGSIQSSVDAGLNAIFSTYQMYGNGDAVWLGAADTATYYGNCADYSICGYGDQLESLALSQNYTCSPTLKIRSQNLTAVQQSSACTTLGAEETYFHNKIQTGNVPIPGDNNSQLQVNIFDSSNDYGKYGGPIFNIGTNNGGMYLEGDPSVATNIPNFVAYEASYAKPDHYVWNLEHEYVHYLDGRFNLFGDFNAPTESVVWWAEGISEYVAKQNDYQAAIDTIKDGSTYTLSTIFATTYDGFDQDRIYRWGYLAVRFMFENHFSEVKAMLAETRAGNWTAYKARLNTWVSNYSTEFTTWTQTVTATGGGTTPNIAPSANVNGPYTAQINTSINFNSNGSTDSDGSIVSYAWSFGDGATSTTANPSYSYSTEGNYTATLTVTDDGGLTNSASALVSITAAPSGNEIENGGSVANLTAATGQTTATYSINVPAGATNLVISISGGTGDADLFTRQGAAPTSSSYNCRPYVGGNNETCTEANPAAGLWFININAYSAFDGVTLTASYDAGSNNIAPTAVVNGPYAGDVNTNITFSSNGSNDTDGSITSYSWNFGDGTASTSANPNHTYATAGTFNVSLTVTDNGGLTHSTSTTATINSVVVNQAPVVYINGPYTGDKDVAVNFSSAASYDPDGSISAYSWNFGDGTAISTQQNPSHSYSASGVYTVTLSITDNGGLMETVSTTATIAGTQVGGTSLTNGSTLNISGAQNSQNTYTFDVPAGATDLSISMAGGTGDADLYVRFGSEATTTTYDCRPYAGGNNETCTISNIQAGTYHIMVLGYNAYTTGLTASYTDGSGSASNVPDACSVQGSQNGGQLQDGTAICIDGTTTTWLTIADVNNYSSIAISTANGTGDLSVDFSNSGWPGSNNIIGSSNSAGNNECIYLTNLSNYWGYIKVSGTSDSASLIVDFDTASCR